MKKNPRSKFNIFLKRHDKITQYISHPNKRVAHIWTGDDTVCRLWSTGGIVSKSKYKITEKPTKSKICNMCMIVYDKQSFNKKRECERVEAYEAGLVLWE